MTKINSRIKNLNQDLPNNRIQKKNQQLVLLTSGKISVELRRKQSDIRAITGCDNVQPTRRKGRSFDVHRSRKMSTRY